MAHRHWRLYILGNANAGSHIRIAEVEMRATIAGADQCTGGTASASSVYPTLVAANAFDNNNGTQWVALVNTSHYEWLAYDFGTPVDVEEIFLRSSPDTYSTWGDFDLQYSDDGAAWIPYARFRGLSPFTGTGQTRTYNITTHAVATWDATPHRLTTNAQGIWTVSASTSFPGGNTQPWGAFDGTDSNLWVTNGTPSGWLKIDFGSGYFREYVTNYSIKAPATAYTTRAPKNWTLEGSNDDINWTVLDTRTNVTGWGNYEVKNFTVAVPDGFRYYRVNGSANNGDSQYFQIEELYLFAIADPSPDPVITTARFTAGGVEAWHQGESARVTAAGLEAWQQGGGSRVTQAGVEAWFEIATLAGAGVVKKKKGKVNKQTSVGTQTITGLGFRPKALIIWTTRQATSGIDNGAQWVMGITDGTAQCCVGSSYADNVATQDAVRVVHNAALLQFVTLGEVSENICTLTAFTDDGFTLNWSAGTADTPFLHYLALGGEDLRAKVAQIVNSTGAQTVTGVGFQPDLIMFLTGIWQSGPLVQDFGHAPAIGWAVSPTKQASTAFLSIQTNPNQNRTYQRTDCCMSIIDANGGGWYGDWSLTAMNADGFALAPRAGSGGTIGSYYLALGGVGADLGVITQPSVTGEQAVTGLAFPPHTVFFQSACKPASTSHLSQAGGFAFGNVVGRTASVQSLNWVADLDNVSPTRSASRDVPTAIMAHGTPAASAPATAMLVEGKHKRFTADGFVVDWTTVDAVQRQIVWVAIGTPPTVPAEIAADLEQDPLPSSGFSPFLVGG